jgi:glycosyltransferase involved in cell wall biosynthesis
MKYLILRTYPTILNVGTYNSQEIGLARALVSKGIECDIVYYSGFKKTRIQTISIKDKIVHIYWMKSFKILNNGFFCGIKKLAEKYDFIQVSEYDQLTSYYFYKNFPQKTLVYQGVYKSNFSIKHNIKTALFNFIFLNKNIFKNTLIITKSDLAKNDMRSIGFNKVIFVGVGIDIERFKKSESKNEFYVFEKNVKYLLYIGNMEKRRNIIFMLKVLKEILMRVPNTKLLLIGTGTCRYNKRIMKTINSLNLESHVIKLGKIKQDYLASIYKNCDIFLLPSTFEIFGMVLMEAMAFDTVVVSSYNGGSSTLIKDCDHGLIEPTFNINQWAKDISDVLLDDNKLNRIQKTAKANITENYTWEIISDKILKILI